MYKLSLLTVTANWRNKAQFYYNMAITQRWLLLHARQRLGHILLNLNDCRFDIKKRLNDRSDLNA